MRTSIRIALLLLTCCCYFIAGSCRADGLKVVVIRHGEKPDNGDNLNCQGLNRSLALPKVLYGKFGIASGLYVPVITTGDKTKSARMFQTIGPYAIKYDLNINSTYNDDDFKHVVKDVKHQSGTVIMTWEHNAIAGLAKAFGVKQSLNWPDNDYDSIWIITFKKKGGAVLTIDKEGLNPSAACSF